MPRPSFASIILFNVHLVEEEVHAIYREALGILSRSGGSGANNQALTIDQNSVMGLDEVDNFRTSFNAAYMRIQPWLRLIGREVYRKYDVLVRRYGYPPNAEARATIDVNINFDQQKIWSTQGSGIRTESLMLISNIFIMLRSNIASASSIFCNLRSAHHKESKALDRITSDIGSTQELLCTLHTQTLLQHSSGRVKDALPRLHVLLQTCLAPFVV